MANKNEEKSRIREAKAAISISLKNKIQRTRFRSVFQETFI